MIYPMYAWIPQNDLKVGMISPDEPVPETEFVRGLVPLDPRFEWIRTTDLGSIGEGYIRGRCLHFEVEPVESIVTGEIVARICLTCDTQLPGDA